jgi:hypothetical protein
MCRLVTATTLFVVLACIAMYGKLCVKKNRKGTAQKMLLIRPHLIPHDLGTKMCPMKILWPSIVSLFFHGSLDSLLASFVVRGCVEEHLGPIDIHTHMHPSFPCLSGTHLYVSYGTLKTLCSDSRQDIGHEAAEKIASRRGSVVGQGWGKDGRNRVIIKQETADFLLVRARRRKGQQPVD